MSVLARTLVALGLVCATSAAQALPPPVPTHQIQDLIVLPGGDMLMLHSSGIFRRSPHDSAWRQVLHVQETRGLRVHGKVAYLQGYAGLHVSTDGGLTWALRKQHWIDAIGADGVLHGCAGQGPETSTDEGRSWQAVREPHPVPRDHPL